MTDENQQLVVAERPKTAVRTGAAVAALVPQSLDEAYRLASAMSLSGLTPNGMKSAEQVLVAIMGGSELGFAPFQACQSLAVINGRVSLWGDSIPALLWSNGFKLKEWFDGEDAGYPDTMTAHCLVTRPDGTEIEGTFSVADAKEARLWTKEGPWQTAKKRMLKMRARSFAARDGAADLLRGLFVAEEVQDYVPIPDAQTGTGMVERLTARATDVDAQGFNVRNITEETRTVDAVLDGDDVPAEGGAKPKRKRRTKAEMEAARAAGEAEGDDDAPEEAEAAPEPAEAEEDAPQPEDAQGAGETSEAEAATPASEPTTAAEVGTQDIGGDTSDDDRPQPVGGAASPSASTAASGAATATAPSAATETKGGDASAFRAVSSAPHAKAGQTYHLASDPVREDGTRAVYKDAVLAGYAHARDRWSVFAEHAPEVAKAGAVEEKSPVSSADSPAPDYEPSVEVGEFTSRLGRADSFQAVRLALASFRRTDAFKETEPEGQRLWQLSALEKLNELREAGVPGVPTHLESPWIFSLWLPSAPKGEIEDAFDALRDAGEFAGLNDLQKDGITDAVVQALGG
jgi:hypothetical protein